jgi:uncharacterized phage protein (TIGR01671 family)
MTNTEFRVWNKKENKYIDSRFYICFFDNPPEVLISNIPFNGQPLPEDLIIEQFIGRFDKNSKAIFESDIVRTHTGDIGVIIFKDCSYQLKMKSKTHTGE